MLSTALIVFREMLEAALLIGIMAAATRGIAGRGRWLSGGVLVGLIGAGLVAIFANAISEWASGMGQEVFNAGVLGLAVIMLAWHSIWMAKHGKEMAQNARSVGSRLQAGTQSLSVLLVVVSLAVLREGSEVVLFLYGIAAAGSSTASEMLAGGAVGALAGVVIGVAIYLGLLRIPLRWFFSVTSALIVALAAGMAAQAARFLEQADILPSSASPVWDTSAILPQQSSTGVLMHALAGYEAQPSALQLLFYLTTMLVIVLGMYTVRRSLRNTHATARPA